MSEEFSAEMLASVLARGLGVRHEGGYGKEYFGKLNLDILGKAVKDESEPRTFGELLRVLERLKDRHKSEVVEAVKAKASEGGKLSLIEFASQLVAEWEKNPGS